MPTALDNDGRRLLQLLIQMAPNIDVPNVGGFLTYLDAHKILGLQLIGRTYGDSLDNQGMGNVAGWAKSNGYPAITSLIISENPPMPAKGFFTYYGKDPMLDINWWLSEAAASKAFDWSKVVNPEGGVAPIQQPPNPAPDLKGAKLVSDIASKDSRFFLKSEWGPISDYWPAMSFGKSTVGDYVNQTYNPDKDFIVYAGTSNPERTQAAENRSALLSLLKVEIGQPIPTEQLVPWESWQNALKEFNKNWPLSFGVTAGWNLKNRPSAREMTPDAYRALGIRSNWGGVVEISGVERDALFSQQIEWVELPSADALKKAAGQQNRVRKMRDNPALNAAAVRLQELIKGRLGGPQSVRVTRPGRNIPAGMDLSAVIHDKIIEQNYLCALCGREMRLDTVKKMLQISPDRKDSSNPSYGPENLQITHLACNLAKNDASTEDFEEWLQLVSGI
jgi:hypothetical protein